MFNDALRAHDPLHSSRCLQVLSRNEGGRRFSADDFRQAVRRDKLVDARAVQRVQRAAAHVKEAFSGAGHRRSSTGQFVSTKGLVARLAQDRENISKSPRDTHELAH
jgi:hypothetical protein